MRPRKRIGVLGTFANVPYAGMAWMHCQFLLGLARLGHDVFYVETTTAWPYHPVEMTTTDDPSYALMYLDRVLGSFGLSDRWAYRASYADGRWYGPLAGEAIDLLRSADAVFNITGSTTPEEIGTPCRLVYIGTDPVLQELRIAQGDEVLRERVAAHLAHFTYGENIGSSICPVPTLPFKTHAMRQPIVLDLWQDGPPSHAAFTTVTNWEVRGYDVEFRGQQYTWSKHHEYLKIIDLPQKTDACLELAMGLSGVSAEVRRLLRTNGWSTVDAYEMSLDPWPYRDYIRKSAAELSVAKDMVARTYCGWFSERSACYLAAGRPVITQNTGFSRSLPTGKGLFAFDTSDDILAAIDAVRSNYDEHSQGARAVAEDFFRAETVLGKVLDTLGF